MTRVEYFGIIGSRLIAECFAFIFHYNLTDADMKKFRVSAYRRITTVSVQTDKLTAAIQAQFGGKITVETFF